MLIEWILVCCCVLVCSCVLLLLLFVSHSLPLPHHHVCCIGFELCLSLDPFHILLLLLLLLLQWW